MKKFLLLHIGFEPPTPEIMEAWGGWFESIKHVEVDSGGFAAGKEITSAGVIDLPMNTEGATGFSIIKAENLAEAVKIAHTCPFITGIRVYELRSMEY